MKPTEGFELELVHEGSSGSRHYLDGRPVHAGSFLQLLTDDGWIDGRYEWSYDADERPYLVTDTDKDEGVRLDAYALLRWPE